jgi:hypothetical protein
MYRPTDNELRAADEADAKRFPANSAEFEVWCADASWKLEVATALSMGYDPEIISPAIIERLRLIFHPHLVETREGLLRLSRRAGIYKDRLRHLEAACVTGELGNAIKAGDAWYVRPLDLLEWFERQVERHGERYPWNGLHPLFVKQVKRDHPAPSNAEAAVSTAPCGAKDTGKERPGPSSLGVSKTKKGKDGLSLLDTLKDRSGKPLKEKTGVIKTWELMRSEITTPKDKRKYPTMKEIRAHCECQFQIAQNDSGILASAAKKLPGAIPYRRGSPSKSKAA